MPWAWRKCHLTEEGLFLISGFNSHEAVFSPGGPPGVLSNPIGVLVFIDIPANDFELLEPSELFGAFNVLIDAGFVGEQIKVDLGGGDDWSIIHNLSFDIFFLLGFIDQTEIVYFMSFTIGHGVGGAFLVPFLVVVGEALLVDQAF